MRVYHHTCGYPLTLGKAADGQPMYFCLAPEGDGEPHLSTCPRCGAPLTVYRLRPPEPAPELILAQWRAAWPELRQQLEALILDRAQHDERFYPYHAEEEIDVFEAALERVSGLASQLMLRQPARSGA
jgi:hypothetical protein